MALKKLTKKMLIAAHDEIDESVGIEPPIKEDLAQDKYEKELFDTIIDLDLNKTEISGFEKGTQEVIATLKEKYGKAAAADDEDEAEEEEEEAPKAPAKKADKKAAKVVEEVEEEEEEDEPDAEEEEDVPTLADAINACKKISELTEIVNANKEFKRASKKLLAMKKASEMKAAMLEIVAPDEEEEEEEEAPKASAKTADKKADAKKGEKKEGAVKKFTSAEYNRVDALVDALKAKPKTIEEWAKEGDKVLTAKGGTVQPNTRENKFTIGYFLKIAKHFDLGSIPKE